MSKKTVLPDNLQSPLGPYSHGVVSNGLIFTSGSIGVDDNTGKLVDGIENQTRKAMENLEDILKEAGSSFESALKFNIYLKSMKDFEKMNDVYSEFLVQPYPARATVGGTELALDALVEIEVIATIDE